MADLTNSQSTTPVEVANETSGNTLAIQSDGSISSRLLDGTGSSISKGQTTMAGSLPVTIASNQTSIPVTTEGAKSTYSAGFSGIVIAAAATDVFTILGSATKVIRITRLACSVTTTAGSGIALNATLIKRSTADTAGTSTTATLVPHDSTNAAGTAVIRSYTANPTLGTSVGTMRSNRFQVSTAGAVENELIWDFGTRPAQGLVLRGVAEQICLNFGGATVTGPIAAFSVEWTEE